jgi:hypothetical protein
MEHDSKNRGKWPDWLRLRNGARHRRRFGHHGHDGRGGFRLGFGGRRLFRSKCHHRLHFDGIGHGDQRLPRMHHLHNQGAANGAAQQQNYDMYGPHRFRPTQ